MTKTAPHAASTIREDNRESETSLQAEQIRLLYRLSLVGYLATLLVLLILGALLWEDLADPWLFGWFGVTAMVTIGRYVLYKSFEQRSRSPREMPLWEARFITGTIVGAMCWSFLGS
ncbi:MAG: hypothetical protein ACM3X5_06970, partial [Bacillota bacterium]